MQENRRQPGRGGHGVRAGLLPRWGLVALAPLPIAAAAAAQGLPVAAPQEIVAGTKSCVAAMSEAGVDERKLEGDGWRLGTMSGDGKAEGGLSFYGKGKLMLVLGKAPSRLCAVTAHIRDQASFGDVASEIEKGLGAAGTTRPGEANTIYWFVPGRIVQLVLTGKPEAPSVRVGVGYFAGEKK